MVTFALPGDTDAAPAVNGTPRARPPLPFANRANGGTPFSSRSSRQLGTPQQSSSRKLLMTRDEMPASSLSRSSMAAARNIFRASSVADSPPPNNVPFSPMLPQSTMKKVFAPGATPEPSRVYRESTAHATPRGMAAKAVEKDLFPMRISSPPRELTGEVLAQKVPKEWNSKGSIYADQFLAHLCPPELDEEQRRQFFCILDLRRLKYAANEIFSKKDWKLNVVNFAKEFEKSRSIILLRYGLYEFQNVKPSKEVLKRWRREHGLPEPEEEEESTPTPTQPAASKKRKADTDLSKTSAATKTESTAGKRRATEQPTVEEPVAIPATSKVLGKNKRRASMDEDAETPNKQPKPAPSAAKSLFEKIANKPATSTESPKPVLFNANKPAAGGLARSVFENLKTGSSQPPSTTSDNIFGYLSDTNSARNSGVEADAESDSESDEDEEEEEESEQTNKSASETSAATPSLTNGAAITSAASLFAPKPSTTSGEDSSAPATRESTPGRSIFDRVTKGNDGQPVRASDAESAAGKASPVADQTWNPATTPLKFAPTSAGSATSLFGKPAASTATSSIFGSAPSPAANLFGSSNAQPSKEATSASESAKDGESDKENESLQIKAPAAEAKPAAPAPAGQSLFQPKPAEAAPAPSTSLFGSASKPTATNLFGAASKPSEAAPATSVSTLFSAKPAEPEKSGSATPVPTFSFGQKSDAAPAATTTATTSTSLFGAAPATTKPLFGAAPQAPKTDTAPAVATPTFSFGAGATSTATKPDAAPAPAPAFSFGAASGTAASKPLFGAPKSPEATSTAGNLFGSPMKQDDQSPAKKMFTGSANAGSATPTFSFGANTSTAPSAAPIFGGATSQPTNSAVSFGSATTNAGNSFGFNFGAEANGNSSFNNPFASGSNGANGATQSSAPAGGFSFTAGSTPSTTPNTSFQFGANPAQSGGSMFGGNTGGSNTPMFGGAPSSGAAPAFSFGAGSGQAPAGGNMFGSNQAAPAFGNSLQPPVGGSSTAGTNSPLNLPGGSSLATTPAAGTPEPSAKADAATAAGDDETEKHEQINLTDGSEEDEEIMHEIRAKVLKFTKADKEDGEDKPKSPWATMGVGPLRVLKHKETNGVRLLLRAEPRGHIAINRSLLPDFTYKADEKYVRLTTANESGDGLETWMVQVKTKDLAKALAEALEENKVHNKKDE